MQFWTFLQQACTQDTAAVCVAPCCCEVDGASGLGVLSDVVSAAFAAACVIVCHTYWPPADTSAAPLRVCLVEAQQTYC